MVGGINQAHRDSGYRISPQTVEQAGVILGSVCKGSGDLLSGQRPSQCKERKQGLEASAGGFLIISFLV